MNGLRDEGVCIRHWDWSETSQTVSLLTRDHGVVRAIAKGARREKGPFSGGIELLTRGEALWIPRSGDALATLTAWDLLETSPGARASLEGFYAGSYMIDLVHHMLTDHDPHPGVFDALVASLRSLTTLAREAVLCFQWALLVEAGYRPSLGEGALSRSGTLWFSPALGGTRDTPVEGGWGVRAATVELLRRVEGGAAPGELGAPPESVDRASRLLASYIAHIVGAELPSARACFPGEALAR